MNRLHPAGHRAGGVFCILWEAASLTAADTASVGLPLGGHFNQDLADGFASLLTISGRCASQGKQMTNIPAERSSVTPS